LEIFQRQAMGENLIHWQQSFGEHVDGDGMAVRAQVRAVDIVDLANPVLAAAAIATLLAGHDLFGDDLVA
tara:strand:+ start:321 stop:530 length:210 start_codon:yes stop_codon:yes gene_type:complete